MKNDRTRVVKLGRMSPEQARTLNAAFNKVIAVAESRCDPRKKCSHGRGQCPWDMVDEISDILDPQIWRDDDKTMQCLSGALREKFFPSTYEIVALVGGVFAMSARARAAKGFLG